MELQKNKVAGEISIPLASRLISFAFIGVGCATPIGITRGPAHGATRLTANALTTDQPSVFSAQQLLI